MKYEDAKNLKKGDLVVIDINRCKIYGGMILEVESINPNCYHARCHVTMKQPGFDNDFRIKDYDSRLLKRYEP